MKTVNELRDETEKARIANFAKWTESTLTERINNAVKKGAYSFTTDVRNLSIPIGYGWEDVKAYLKSVDSKFDVSVKYYPGDLYSDDVTDITVSWAEPEPEKPVEKKKHFWNK